MTHDREAYELHSVVHLVRPSGVRVRTLEELRAGIAGATAECLFHHALQYQLRDPACHELPPDDLSGWVKGVVQDRETAERLSYAVQNRSASAAELRQGLREVLDALPEPTRATRGAPADGEFVFLAAESVTVPTGVRVNDGGELLGALATADASVWFYHVIEQPWFPGSGPSAADWLSARGEARLAAWLAESAVSGLPIETARRRLLARWRRSHLGRRLAAAAQSPEGVRREEGRAVVARLVRQIQRPEPPA